MINNILQFSEVNLLMRCWLLNIINKLTFLNFARMHIIEKKRDLIKDLNKSMFNSKLKDNAKTTVNKNIEKKEEEKLKLGSQINQHIRYENQRNNELEENLFQCKKHCKMQKFHKKPTIKI